LRRVEVAHDAHELHLVDVYLLYESTFLTAVALFEALLEDVLVEAACGSRGSHVGSYAIATARSRDKFRTMIYHGRPYIDLMPFDHAVDIARLYLNEARPFGQIPPPDRQYLAEIVWTRNAVAHRSDSASRVFRQKVPGVTALAKAQQRPGPFLRTVYRVNPRQTRNELYLATMARITQDLAGLW
jgi:hypothetical protein